MEVEITPRARLYGYLIWPASRDSEMKALIGNCEEINLFFLGADHGTKRVDWKNRRISIGYTWTRRLHYNKTIYVISFKKPCKLVVTCR
jgi:hypothetical protein